MGGRVGDKEQQGGGGRDGTLGEEKAGGGGEGEGRRDQCVGV